MSHVVLGWRYGIPIFAVLFFAGWFRLGETHWYEDLMFGGLMVQAAVGVRSWATARSRALQAAAIGITLGCLALDRLPNGLNKDATSCY
jgi:hypothetical protein